MALEAVVFPHGLFGCTATDSFGSYEFETPEAPEVERDATPLPSPSAAGRRKKRQRTRSCRSKEEAEIQRMSHIAVERNRRKLMNEHLSVLRSIMPPSYVQRVDQASIVGGAINFVKELEQLLQTLQAQRRHNRMPGPTGGDSSPFSDFFSFPRYSSTASRLTNADVANEAVDDIEVTMVERFVNLKVLSRRRPRRLVRMLAGLQDLRLTTLHLNVTTVDGMVLHSFSLKAEDDCHLTSVDDIATAVHCLIGKIQEALPNSKCQNVLNRM